MRHIHQVYYHNFSKIQPSTAAMVTIFFPTTYTSPSKKKIESTSHQRTFNSQNHHNNKTQTLKPPHSPLKRHIREKASNKTTTRTFPQRGHAHQELRAPPLTSVAGAGRALARGAAALRSSVGCAGRRYALGARA